MTFNEPARKMSLTFTPHKEVLSHPEQTQTGFTGIQMKVDSIEDGRKADAGAKRFLINLFVPRLASAEAPLCEVAGSKWRNRTSFTNARSVEGILADLSLPLLDLHAFSAIDVVPGQTQSHPLFRTLALRAEEVRLSVKLIKWYLDVMECIPIPVAGTPHLRPQKLSYFDI